MCDNNSKSTEYQSDQQSEQQPGASRLPDIPADILY